MIKKENPVEKRKRRNASIKYDRDDQSQVGRRKMRDIVKVTTREEGAESGDIRHCLIFLFWNC